MQTSSGEVLQTMLLLIVLQNDVACAVLKTKEFPPIRADTVDMAIAIVTMERIVAWFICLKM
jgi:hypothetical protein